MIVVAFVVLFALLTSTNAEVVDSADMRQCRVYFGTGMTGDRAGIYTSILDLRTGQLGKASLAGKAIRPGFIALHPDGTRLYTIGKPAGYRGPRSGSVCAFKINPKTGSLTLINSQPSKGNGPCYLFVDPQGRNVLVGHYRTGNCSVLPLAKDGSLKPVSSVQQHKGSSSHPRRQTSPHPHSIVLDSAGKYAFVADLGLDQIRSYRFDSVAGTLTPNSPPFIAVAPGSGPRHFIFGPLEKFAYGNLELTSEVAVFSYDPTKGRLKILQTISTLPNDFSGNNANAGICITPEGSFLYVSNRGHNSIAMFSVDRDTGKLTSLGSESTRGDVPQAISIDPTGRYLIVTDKRAGHVRVFEINKKTGKLTYTGSSLNIPKVGRVVFLPR